jgi:hypothetical protein
MSRGPGKVERVIEALFADEPSRTFSTDELVAAVYRSVNRVEKKHRVAVLRAADKVATRLHWDKWQCERWGQGGYGPSVAGRGALYVNTLDLRSYALGRLRVDDSNAGTSVTELAAMLRRGEHAQWIAPGGSWWLHVQQAKADAGLITLDRKTKRMIEAQQKDFEARWQPGPLAALRASDDERQERARRREANQHGRLCGKCGKAIKADEPVARVPVKTRVLFGYGAPLVVQCLKCAESHFAFDRRWGKANCETCGREVHERYRRNRARTFCCEACRRPVDTRRVTPSRALNA